MSWCPNPKGLTVAADVLLAAASCVLLISILYLIFTDFDTVDQIVLYYEIALVFAGIIYVVAAVYLHFMVLASDNYKKILVSRPAVVTCAEIIHPCLPIPPPCASRKIGNTKRGRSRGGRVSTGC